MILNISQNGVELIKHFEGLRLEAYKPVPTEKYYTIGYGHYSSDLTRDSRITQDDAEMILKKDLEKFVAGVNDVLLVPVNQNQFDALVSFAYNLGISALRSSTLLKLVNQRKFTDAEKQFSAWVHAGGQVLGGLVKRRQAEKELFNKTYKPIATTTSHTVSLGETLGGIADDYNTTVKKLLSLNPKITNQHIIYAGRKIIVPK